MKDTIFITLFTLAIIAVAIGFILPFASLLTKQPTKHYTTYETGLYVESEQVQQTIDGKEIQ